MYVLSEHCVAITYSLYHLQINPPPLPWNLTLRSRFDVKSCTALCPPHLSPRPLHPHGHCRKCLNGRVSSFLHSATWWILNVSCLIYGCRMLRILQKALRAKSLSLRNVRFGNCVITRHAGIFDTQQVIRNRKKTSGKWQSHFGAAICWSICSVWTCLHEKQTWVLPCMVRTLLLSHSVSTLFKSAPVLSIPMSQLVKSHLLISDTASV